MEAEEAEILWKRSIELHNMLTQGKIKQLQKYYGWAIRQNTLSKANASEREVDVAVVCNEKEHCCHTTSQSQIRQSCKGKKILSSGKELMVQVVTGLGNRYQNIQRG